jgi:hypothetical protein
MHPNPGVPETKLSRQKRTESQQKTIVRDLCRARFQFSDIRDFVFY